ncbi:MAG: hypothetical protein E6661_03190 [Enterobacter sp.]|jgi:hypothetical protein|uniref:hypothetical protein n=1 Tax=Enterobacteriaceae TaxID=543 RepID=UPI000794C9A8|nr:MULTISPECIES: hypothetical protein [Enterobacteriaceae]PTA96956.1 hypothetical protein C9415_02805 [Kluyvera sp. Nf5]QIH63582.1 hypothetical protein CRX67_10910 [Enterobacteriaceae bacterium A-F18]MCU4024349.1 hypothetical protein [Enterobacter roggenkampii]MDU6057354.1 hypothetical protein [Enterobacter sp.]TKV19299.1 hypothetical protein FDX01_15835 [Citrobacter sp. wls613]
MKRLMLTLAVAAGSSLSAPAMADNIVCRDGWSVERHVTGSAESGFLSYRKDAGIIKLFHRGKLISEKRIQNIQQSVYQTSGAPLINYEFDVDRNNFYILVLDMSTQGASGGEPDIKLWGTDAMGLDCILQGGAA